MREETRTIELMTKLRERGLVVHDLRGVLPVHPTKRFATRNVDELHGLVWHHSAMEGNDTSDIEKIARYHVSPGEHVSYDGKVTRIGRLVNRLPVSVQYGRMLVEADRLGVVDDVLTVAAILELVDELEVAFTGDSRIEVVEREEIVRKARLLVMEVTFLDERVSVEKSRVKGHIHLDEVIERADLFENQAILFTHLSDRYSPKEAERILRERLPSSLRGRVFLLTQKGQS